MSYIGLDIGGTNIRYAFADGLETNDLKYQKRPFVKTGDPYSEVEINICSYIDNSISEIKGISISLAAIMDRTTGRVKTWPNNHCWNYYELMRHLRGRYHVPIVIEDDANCGAIGEYLCISARTKNMAYISIGTGIGCGLVLNGSLFIGENGFAGELGHVWIDKAANGIVCSCGNKGCCQSLASGSAVLKEYNTGAKANLESLEQVYDLYVQNDPKSIECFSNMIDNISMVTYNLAMCLDLSVFIIGGGVSNTGARFISNIENKVNDRLKSFEREIVVGQARLGEFSGVYGALALLKSYIEKG